MEIMRPSTPEELEQKIEAARTVFTNLNSFKDWSFAAYKVEEHEKDIVIEAISHYLNCLRNQLSLTRLGDELNNAYPVNTTTEDEAYDLTEVCD